MLVNIILGFIVIQEQIVVFYFDVFVIFLQFGDVFCVSLCVDDFMDLIGMFFIVSYDVFKLSYIGVFNLNGDFVGFNEVGNIVNFSLGFIIVNWVENSLSLIIFLNGSIMMDLCFEVMDCGVLVIVVILDVVILEFNDFNDNSIFVVFIFVNLVIIEDLCCFVSIVLLIVMVIVGESICVVVIVSGFQEISSVSFVFSYDF